ncbi:MAG: hypothetical protein V2I43_18730 [Parvularcula sp.]|jgi:hypothetical protein|nr:hypothetical protein [Parvularcula sp.]
MSTQLPNIELAYVEQSKIVDYLLNTSKMPGAAKARFFMAFGFRLEHWEEMAEALKEHAKTNPVEATSESRFGIKFEIEGPIRTPDGRSPRIWTVWQIDKDRLAPRLITAYPSHK